MALFDAKAAKPCNAGRLQSVAPYSVMPIGRSAANATASAKRRKEHSPVLSPATSKQCGSVDLHCEVLRIIFTEI